MKKRCSRGCLYRLVSDWKCWSALAAFTLSSATALAQKPVQMEDETGGMLPWAIAAGIIVLVCGSAFLNPNRSHQG